MSSKVQLRTLFYALAIISIFLASPKLKVLRRLCPHPLYIFPSEIKKITTMVIWIFTLTLGWKKPK